MTQFLLRGNMEKVMLRLITSAPAFHSHSIVASVLGNKLVVPPFFWHLHSNKTKKRSRHAMLALTKG